jgi:hypothetical protein
VKGKKERPRCRRVIENMLRGKPGGLEQLVQEMKQNRHRYSEGLRIQARKMLEERKRPAGAKIKSFGKGE